MTLPRNTPRTRLVLRALVLFALLCVSWSRNASAQVFAPICDESASSAIAPIPIEPHEHGEIRKVPCAPFALLEAVDGFPGDPEPPKVNLDAPQMGAYRKNKLN